MMELSLGNLSLDEEIKMLKRFEKDEPLESLENVVNASDGVNEEESKVLSQFNEYIESRA